ncbi:hypothetical protein JCM14036_22310 [Desulfotomaculum defluvii]
MDITDLMSNFIISIAAGACGYILFKSTRSAAIVFILCIMIFFSISYYESNKPTKESSSDNVSKNILLFNVGSTIYYSNQCAKVMEVAPYTKDGRTYVPVDFIAKEMDIDMFFENSTATLTQGDKVFKLTIGSSIYELNGSAYVMDVAPEAKNGHFMLPTRYVIEALGAEIGYANGQTVIGYYTTATRTKEKNNSISFFANSPVIGLRGKTKVMDIATYTKGGYTYVPIDYLAEAMDASMGFAQGFVVIAQGDKVVKLTIGDTKIDVNGIVTTMDVAPEVKNGRVMLPPHFVAEALGAQTGYDNNIIVIAK